VSATSWLSATPSETFTSMPSETVVVSETLPPAATQTPTLTQPAASGAQPGFGPLHCCGRENPGQLADGLTLPVGALLSYNLMCAGCGAPRSESYSCDLPFYAAAGWIETTILPGIVVSTTSAISYVYTSEVHWSSSRYPILCSGSPVQVIVDASGFPVASGQTATIYAGAQLVRSADIVGVTPDPTPAPLWYAAPFQYRVTLP
jgi:hypothetical protein